jgi:hypothetical protein
MRHETVASTSITAITPPPSHWTQLVVHCALDYQTNVMLRNVLQRPCVAAMRVAPTRNPVRNKYGAVPLRYFSTEFLAIPTFDLECWPDLTGAIY